MYNFIYIKIEVGATPNFTPTLDPPIADCRRILLGFALDIGRQLCFIIWKVSRTTMPRRITIRVIKTGRIF
jgi:hypothetical protein